MNSVLKSAIVYVKTGDGLKNEVQTIEGLQLPSACEDDRRRCDQIRQIVKMLQDYVADPSATRPLSIVIFGPPGSGKSTFVKRITAALKGCRPIPTANLTQLAEPDELVETFLKAIVKGRPPATPVFFFDEFDASLNDAPLGWLRWFLAPMQDGKLLVDGREKPIGKAVFFFAGGTAESLDEFNRRAQLDLDAYRARKVPDFVSRLRGSIDIGGINGFGNARYVARAVVLHRLLRDRKRELKDDQIERLLSNGHFVHGVRSMEALLDAPHTKSGDPKLPEAIRQQHFSRGALDGKLVGISAGIDETLSQEMFEKLTKQLLQNGASLAYGGNFVHRGTLDQVVTAAAEAPSELRWAGRKNREKPVWNYLGFPASLIRDVVSRPDLLRLVKFIKLRTLSDDELREFDVPSRRWFAALPRRKRDYDPRRHVAWALSLFRMRVRLIQDLSALIVLGGKDDGRSWGRFAGIAEEVMIAIALRKPVYVLGGAGGAALATGQLLGLDATTPDLRRCLVPAAQAELEQQLDQYAHCFEIPGVSKSPIDLAALREFLYHNGVMTPAWPWNGLEPQENRDLFRCPLAGNDSNVDGAVELIVQGLSRLDWKTQPSQPA